jgi:hypothetical protein
MIGQKTADLENKDFFDLVYHADQSQLQSLFSSLLNPTGANGDSVSSSTSSSGSGGQLGAGRTQTAYARIISSDTGDSSRSGPAAWELRAHATGLDSLPVGFAGAGGYRLDGTVIPRTSGDEGTSLKGKAIWLMGRRIGNTPSDELQSWVLQTHMAGTNIRLDSFLELKLENEKLREELRELQYEIDDEDYQGCEYVSAEFLTFQLDHTSIQ